MNKLFLAGAILFLVSALAAIFTGINFTAGIAQLCLAGLFILLAFRRRRRVER